MLLKFKQAVKLGDTEYKFNSVHELTDEMLSHPFLERMFKAGLVFEVEAAKVIKPESMVEGQKRLAEVLAKKAPAKAPEKAPEKAPSESLEDSEKAAEAEAAKVEEKSEEKYDKKKSKR